MDKCLLQLSSTLFFSVTFSESSSSSSVGDIFLSATLDITGSFGVSKQFFLQEYKYMTKTTTILYIFTKKMSKLCEEHKRKGNLKIYFFAMGFRVIILLLIKRYTTAIHISETEINKIYSFIKFT